MSLKNIGNILDYVKYLKQFETFDDIANSAEYTTEILYTLGDRLKDFKELDNVGKFNLLQKLGLSADVAQTLSGVSDDIAKAGSAATEATSGVSAFGLALKGLWATIAPFRTWSNRRWIVYL